MSEATLTGREAEVLRGVADGLPNKVIADGLGLSENTVKFHLGSIMNKPDAQSRTDAVGRAIRSGQLDL